MGNAVDGGGGVYVGPGATLTASYCEFSTDMTPGNGGGILAQGAAVKLNNCTFNYDYANGGTSSGGGGICVMPFVPQGQQNAPITPASLTVQGTTFTHCVSTGAGGGVFVGDIFGSPAATTATIGQGQAKLANPDTTFTNCTAGLFGGAVSSGGLTSLLNCSMTGCTGNSNGFVVAEIPVLVNVDTLTMNYCAVTVSSGDWGTAAGDVAAVQVPNNLQGDMKTPYAFFTGTTFISGGAMPGMGAPGALTGTTHSVGGPVQNGKLATALVQTGGGNTFVNSKTTANAVNGWAATDTIT